MTWTATASWSSLRAIPGQDCWKAELNFLAWQPFDKEATRRNCPTRRRLRLSIQWREAHEPEFFRRGEDLYLQPLARLRLVVLRQRDPSGQKLPLDDFEVVARSEGLPQRLDNQPNTATYEQTVEFTADPVGRYAVRVEGNVLPGTRPASTPTVPAVQTSWELHTRLFVEAIDAASRLAGRPVFGDYATDLGNLGMLGGAHGVITVGAADLTGQRRPYSAGGPPLQMELLAKPDTLAFDGLRPGGRQRQRGLRHQPVHSLCRGTDGRGMECGNFSGRSAASSPGASRPSAAVTLMLPTAATKRMESRLLAPSRQKRQTSSSFPRFGPIRRGGIPRETIGGG